MIIHIAEADLRGVPFERYAAVLHNLVGERFQPDGITISLGRTTLLLIADATDDVDAGEVAELARTITDPEVRDGYFG